MTTKAKHAPDGETARMGRRGRGWWGQTPRVSEEHRLAMARARSARYRQGLDRRREPTNQDVACALLAAYAEVTADGGGTMRALHEALVSRLLEREYDTGLAAKRIARLRERLKL